VEKAKRGMCETEGGRRRRDFDLRDRRGERKMKSWQDVDLRNRVVDGEVGEIEGIGDDAVR